MNAGILSTVETSNQKNKKRNNKINENTRPAVAVGTRDLNKKHTASDIWISEAYCSMARAYIGSFSYSHADKQTFVVDSGATHHMYSSVKYLSNIQSVPEYSVTLGDGGSIKEIKLKKLTLC